MRGRRVATLLLGICASLATIGALAQSPGLAGSDWHEETFTVRSQELSEQLRAYGSSQIHGESVSVVVFVNGLEAARATKIGGSAGVELDLVSPGTYVVRVECQGGPSEYRTCGLRGRNLAQAPPPGPATRPDPNNEYWVLLEDMVYEIGDTGQTITVPAGFVHDFASIPQALHSFGLSPHGTHSRAAIIHDWLFWSKGCSLPQSNRLMVLAMKESGVHSILTSAIYKALEGFGEKAWEANKKEYEEGLPRIIPAGQRKFPPNMGWTKYRTELAKQGVRDPVFTKPMPYCEFGDSLDVPTKAQAAARKDEKVMALQRPPEHFKVVEAP